MDDAKPQKPWHHGQTGTTARELEGLDDGFKTTPIEEMFPTDSMGNRTVHGHCVAHTYEEMDEGVITTRRGRNDPPEDPVKSQAQRRAMYAAASGHSNLGIPKSVGKEFISSSHGLKNLPERAHKKGH